MEEKHEDQLLAEIAYLVSDFTGISVEQITPETTLFADCRLDGDDAIEFLSSFATLFGVDMGSCVIHRHFGAEAGGNPLSLLKGMAGWLAGVDPHAMADVMPISVMDLLRAASSGSWTGTDYSSSR